MRLIAQVEHQDVGLYCLGLRQHRQFGACKGSRLHAARTKGFFELTIVGTDEHNIYGHGKTPYRTSWTTQMNAAFAGVVPTPVT